eukprot:GILI01007336.1.p1 GENE.GILI01007336.1~~GILI01007336.1.p1  ORF type:complete len:878 (+),score=219.16 GILI01007336.1:344-2635(+)
MYRDRKQNQLSLLTRLWEKVTSSASSPFALDRDAIESTPVEELKKYSLDSLHEDSDSEDSCSDSSSDSSSDEEEENKKTRKKRQQARLKEKKARAKSANEPSLWKRSDLDRLFHFHPDKSLIEDADKLLRHLANSQSDCGFAIFMLLSILHTYQPDHDAFRKLKQDLAESESADFKPPSPSAAYLEEGDYLSYTPKQARKAWKYFASNTGSIEVNRDGSLELVYFRILEKCKYLTYKSRKEIIHNAVRISLQDKLEYFIGQSPVLEEEMDHQKKLSEQNKLIEWMSAKWTYWKDFSFIMCIVMNILMIVYYHVRDGQLEIDRPDDLVPVKALLTLFGAFQIIASVIITLLHAIEYGPVIVFKARLERERSEKRKKKRKDELKGSLFSRLPFLQGNKASSNAAWLRRLCPCRRAVKGPGQAEIGERSVLPQRRHNHKGIEATWRVVRKWSIYLYDILRDPTQFYYVLYLLFSLLGYSVHVFFYALLLTDIVHRSDDLKNVLKSVTRNGLQLLITAALGLVVIYVYSLFGFYFFRSDYSSDADTPMFCETLWMCLASTINYGLRAGGGIGEVLLKRKDYESGLFWGRWIFDITFFIIVPVVLLNIIFGIIIDTFAELRDERRAIQTDITERCFICGIDKNEFDNKSKTDFNTHTDCDHNVYAYLNFIVYIKNRQITDCNGVERFVKQKIEKTNPDVSWFPMSRALCLDTENDLETNTIEDKVEELRSGLSNLTSKMDMLMSVSARVEDLARKLMQQEEKVASISQ